MPSTQDYLNLISQYESGNRNIPNYQFGPGVTAQGYYQITDQNWNNVAPVLGIDTSVYPNAMSAPQSVQAQVATYLLTQTPAGISNWSNYNANLAAALSAAGLQTSGPIAAAVPGYTAAAAGAGPLFDLSGAAAATPTADILNQLDTSLASTFSVSDGGSIALVALGLVAGLVVLANR